MSSELIESATVNESEEVPLTNTHMESQEVPRSPAFPFPPPAATPPELAISLPDLITSAPHSPPPPGVPPRPLNPIIRQIQKDGIAGIFLKYQLPATIVASFFALISGKPWQYESTVKIVLGLLGLVVLALIAGKVLRDERPVIAAAAELDGISLGAASIIYPISVLLGGPILCYVPPIIGVVVAGMYIYRLATASGDTDTDTDGDGDV